MNKRRLLIVSHSAKPSGAEITLLRMAPFIEDLQPLYVFLEHGPMVQALRARGHDVIVHAAALGGTVVRRKSTLLSRARLMIQLVKTGRALRQHDAGLVVATSIKSAVVAQAATTLSNRKMIWWLHDHLSGAYLGTVTARLMRFAFGVLPAAHIFNSESTRSAAGSPDRPHLVLSPSIDQSPKPALVRKHLSSRPLQIVMVGRISDWKGQHILLDALSRVDRTMGHTHIVGGTLFGEDDYLAHLQSMVSNLGLGATVTFDGHVDQPLDIVENADVLVHASVLPEPFGTVIVEGMAAACIVIAADAGGPAEIIESGRTGLLFEPGNPAALARRLAEVADMTGPEKASMASNAVDASCRYQNQVLGPVLNDFLTQWTSLRKIDGPGPIGQQRHLGSSAPDDPPRRRRTSRPARRARLQGRG